MAEETDWSKDHDTDPDDAKDRCRILDPER